MFRHLIVSPISLLTIILCFSSLTFHNLQSQNHFNYFGDELLTFRHGHNWIASQGIDVIYEVIKTGEAGRVNSYQFDHNGLPEKIIRGNWNETWKPGDTLEWERGTDFLYVMKDLFLRQESFHLIKNEKGKWDTLSTSVRYINFFNRPNYSNSEGVKLEYYFDNNNRLIQMELKYSSKANTIIELSYESSRLNEVMEFRKVNGHRKLLRSAEYVYDNYNRPSKILALREEQLRIVEIDYGTDGYPIAKRVIENEKIVKDIEYIYIHKDN